MVARGSRTSRAGPTGGRGDLARTQPESIRTLEEQSVESKVYIAETQLTLAKTLWESGTRASRVASLARGSADLFRDTGDHERVDEAERWLAARRL